MAYFPWSDEYSVGIRVIDKDHQSLFEIVNHYHDAFERGESNAVIASAIASLARYVGEHFEREEHYLAEYGYPDLAQHKDAHFRMRKLIHAVRKLHATRPDWIDEEKFLGFLKNWLAHHICDDDMKYVPYLKGGQSHAAGPEAGARKEAGTAQPSPAQPTLEPVTVEVPHDKVKIIQRCARLLAEGGAESQSLIEIADPITGMSILEAQEIAKALMR